MCQPCPLGARHSVPFADQPSKEAPRTRPLPCSRPRQASRHKHDEGTYSGNLPSQRAMYSFLTCPLTNSFVRTVASAGVSGRIINPDVNLSNLFTAMCDHERVTSVYENTTHCTLSQSRNHSSRSQPSCSGSIVRQRALAENCVRMRTYFAQREAHN